QEEGEVQALLDDAKVWMEQWFKEIRPWNSKDIDVERTIWLRVYGIPIHAWNDSFFAQLVKPWGHFINEDDGTRKKITMDVARLMIRTSCQQVIDEFFDVKAWMEEIRSLNPIKRRRMRRRRRIIRGGGGRS
ncbi:hypothetical protein L195_g059005, partial [Trifolium pratense]